MEYNFWTIAPIVLLPLFAFVINAFIVKQAPKLAVGISCSAIFLSFLYSIRIFNDFVFGNFSANFYVHKVFNWFSLSFGSQIFKVDMGIYIDNMTAIMLVMVTGIAFLIHVFSTYYMCDDKRFGRFFVYLSLFTSSMLGLVLSDNLLSVFIFWELMGFCSYSLIGFYYEKEEAGNASMKAFMTTRVGDVFFLLGILAIWNIVGSVNFVDIYVALADGKFASDILIFGIAMPIATFAGISVFLGTVGKSAQFPLQVWLPDAMMGPTPCSALIHAATMVAAGVYLSLRMYPLMDAGGLLTVIAYIGAITAFGAATIALVQTDIKAVLAYSTISQLGYMVLGIGMGSYNAAFMHLITHAVFKACLFLSAGSVIHSIHVQEMPKMGGLRHKLPFTFWAMMLCTFAISGIPFFSGFVSKDRILGDALIQALENKVMIIPMLLGFIAALLTAFYMFRMMFLTFFGEPRDKELYKHVHQEKLKINHNVPLLILALFTFGYFYSGSPTGQGIINLAGEKKEWFKELVKKPQVDKFYSHIRTDLSMSGGKVVNIYEKAKYAGYINPTKKETFDHNVHIVGALISIIIAFSGLFFAYLLYIKKSISPSVFVKRFSGIYKLLQNKYHFDTFYLGFLIKLVLLPINRLLAFIDMGLYDRYAVDGVEKVNKQLYKLANFFDNVFVDKIAVDGTGTSIRFFNVILRTIQSGKIQFYFIIFILVLASYIWKAVQV